MMEHLFLLPILFLWLLHSFGLNWWSISRWPLVVTFSNCCPAWKSCLHCQYYHRWLKPHLSIMCWSSWIQKTCVNIALINHHHLLPEEKLKWKKEIMFIYQPQASSRSISTNWIESLHTSMVTLECPGSKFNVLF